jgi:DNA-binding sugar fermentation-stimulating protein
MPSTAHDTPEPALVAFPDTPDRRLRRALRDLERAMAEQSEAVAAFRQQIQALRGAVGGLDARAQTFRTTLREAAEDADRARAAALDLMTTAAALEARARR